MAGFSSCYFCGTALDASVDDRPVVPDDLAPSSGSRRTVTLCPTCNRKLDAVMDEVRQAVRRAEDLEPGAESGGTDDGGSGDPSAEEFFDESPAIRDLSDQESETESSTRDGGRGTEPDAARASSEGATNARASVEEPDAGETGDWETGDGETGGGKTGGGKTGGGKTGGGKTGGGKTGGGKTGGGEIGEGGDTEDAEEAEEDNQSITALENSKVMRMLENRAFPVERAPFETVAANAYEVRPRDVGKVIDMAIDRGLLAEEDGNLVRPE